MNPQRSERGQYLRLRAEAMLAAQTHAAEEHASDDVRALLHDLSVHQIELELQNEELRNTQQSVLQARDDYARLYNQAPFGYLTVDSSGIILQANATFSQMVLMEPNSIVGKSFADFLLESDRDVFFARYKAFFKAPIDKSMELSLRRKGASAMHARLTGRRDSLPQTRRRFADGGTLLLVVHDISEMHLARQALLAEKERLAVTLRSVGDAVIATDIDGRINLMNRVAEELTGYSAEAAYGRPLTEVFRLRDAQTKLPCPCPIEQLLKPAGAINYTPEGEQPLRLHNCVLLAFDESERTVTIRIARIRDFSNQVSGVVLVCQDATEEDRMQQELQRMAKLDSLGVMAGGIAHDFNNLLTVIAGNMGLASTLLYEGESTDAARCIGAAEQATKRARDLTRQLLTFARGGKPMREDIALGPVAREAVAFALTGSRSRCELQTQPDLWPVHADASQIAQVLHNLLLNADQAQPDGGQIEMRLRNTRVESGDAGVLLPGNYVRIDVIDHGIGIAEAIRDKIFDPFFSTKPSGSGLGLASAYSIVRNHDGQIRVASKMGEGSHFSVFLPAVTAPLRQRESSIPAPPSNTVPWRILVLDDEDLIATTAKRILKSRGHRVTTVNNGRDAIAQWTAAMDAGDPFQLAILDLTIPGGVGGKDVVAHLRRIDPNFRAIASSGYAMDPIMASPSDFGFEQRLPKPYTKNEMLAVVAKMQGFEVPRPLR